MLDGERHYAEHHGKPTMTSSLNHDTRSRTRDIVEGPDNTWQVVRGLMGNMRKTHPGRFAVTSHGLRENLVHGSDSADLPSVKSTLLS